jgi:tight adherence protein B
MKLKPGAVTVLENGQQVTGVSVTAVGATVRQKFGVVLVLDASTSMEGRPERAALAAARAFAATRKPEEELGLVTYNVAPKLVLPLSTDDTTIDDALSKQPVFIGGTHIFDAVVRSLNVLKSAHVKAGTIVLLSDGQEARAHHNDTGRHESEATAAAAARSAHVRVFTVGLRSRLAHLSVLRLLARDTGGRYVEARSIDALKSIYNQLGSQLANEYLIRYGSSADPGRRVGVAVKVKGIAGVATTAYETPKLALPKASPHAPYQPSLSHRIWTSALTMVFVGLIAAALVGGGAVAIVSGPYQGTVRQRMAEFVSVPSAIRDSSRRPTAQVTEKMLQGTHNLLRNATWWQRFRWELEVASISMPAEQIVVLSLVGSVFALAVIKFVTGSILLSLAVGIVIPFVVRSYIKRELSKRREKFAEQLPDNLQVLASALRAGHSFIGALAVVVDDAPEPARSEFQRVIADEQLGVPVDQALHVVVERMDNRDLEQVALVAALQHETGGNTAEVLDRVTATIRERFELRRTVRTLTAQGRMSRWILTLLPIFLFLVVNVINPGYMHILYSSGAGKVILVFAVISVTAGSFVIKRIVNIKV